MSALARVRLLHALVVAALCVLAGCQRAADAGTGAPAPSAEVPAAPPLEPTARATVAPAFPPLDATHFASDEEHDLIIRGGEVVDGTGRPPFAGDVVIDDGQIVHVGVVGAAVKARRTLDAKGKVVTPGFIDTHAHTDPLAHNKSFLAQGVTTVCVGQDGQSPSGDRIKPWARRVGRKKLSVNVVPFAGHATVRSVAKVGGAKEVSPRHIERMAKVVEEELAAGAWGLTTGLEYHPGRLAGPDELMAIAKPVGAVGGLIMSHLRSEDDDAIDAALDELIAQGDGTGARVHVAHVKVVYGKGAERAERLLAHLEQARGRGVKITADIYPYDASYTTIAIVFPDWASTKRSFDKARRGRAEELRTYLRERVARRNGPEATLFGRGKWAGKTLAQAAEAAGKPFEDVLMAMGPSGGSAAFFVMDDALQTRLLRDAHVNIATDGGGTSQHPRGYGAFARVIAEHVNKRGTLSLEEAVRKMSGLAAETLGLERRGRLEKGFAADVLVFDPKSVEDRATYERPTVYAAGMSWVLVNGEVTWQDGEITRARKGKLLLRPTAPRPSSGG